MWLIQSFLWLALFHFFKYLCHLRQQDTVVHFMSPSKFFCLDLNPLPQTLSLKFAMIAIPCFKLLCEREHITKTFGAPHHWVSFLGPLSLQEDIYFYISEITFFLLPSFYFLRKNCIKYIQFFLYINQMISLTYYEYFSKILK